MGYYVRVFCKAEKLPSVNDVLKWFDTRDCQFSIEIADSDIDADSCQWTKLALVYEAVSQLVFSFSA